MNCMKCGREIKGAEVFCPDCVADMEKYPVKPGTLVNLPRRTPAHAPKKQLRRRVLKPDELLLRQRHTIHWLIIALVVLVLAFAFVALMLLMILSGLSADDLKNLFIK